MAALVAIISVLAGFLTQGELLPGGDELPYLMLAQSLLHGGGFSIERQYNGPEFHGPASQPLTQLAARQPGGARHSARSPRQVSLKLSDVIAHADGAVAAPSRSVAGVTEGLATRLWWLLGSSARAAWAEPGATASINPGFSIHTPSRSSSLQPNLFRIGDHHHV